MHQSRPTHSSAATTVQYQVPRQPRLRVFGGLLVVLVLSMGYWERNILLWNHLEFSQEQYPCSAS